ncbi:cidABC operon transcriptional activator CidR [Paenibacillus pinistramenti]|uniref:cidABC operon transcriptional activator CidR n=1 Tax=Paenibacillus pinistramenti TaxID=1768003 RepID=UPI00193ACA02|nr:LysR family transcriptional regulator [Paenibacillus pinistramenti]
MDIRQLQYLVEVARLRSFTKAAEALFITQPTISKTIRQMEEELGIVLFAREGRSITLTDAGRIIVDRAQEILNSFQSLSGELDDLRNLKRGHIRIGLPPMVGSSFFPKVMGQFHSSYPDITIRLFEDGSKKVEIDVEEGSLDLGVVVLPTTEGGFEVFPFVEEKLNLLLPPSHRLAQSSEISLEELQEEYFLIFREDFALHDRIIKECQGAGFQPKIIYESSQWDLISQMVAAGLGIALLPETICREMDPDRVRIVPMTVPVIPWNLGIIWKKDRYLSFAAREWIRLARTVLQQEKK